MKADLLLAKEKGTTALTAFVEERLVTNSTGFFQTLPKLKLGSFRYVQKKTSVTAVSYTHLTLPTKRIV